MWIRMFMGERIFTCENGELALHFGPLLPGWMFDENGDASFTFLSKCRVTYHNPSHKDTFGDNAAKVESIVIRDSDQKFAGGTLYGETAEAVREGKIKEIIVNLN
jgi:hypothetical protein